ncbi:hypothetical protein A6R68_10782, partial [Neotoma lepida]
MGAANDSTFSHFILVGFSDRPQLERVLFAVILPAYLLTLLGNSTIILVSRLDPHLHTPMYFFLTHLSFLDLSFTSSSIPQLLYNLSGQDKTISYVGCALQLVLFLGLGGVECLLLAVMAYDRFVAVCKPLHYMVIMSPRLCLILVSLAWGCGVANSLIMSPMTLWLPRCGYRRVDHFLCEMPALIRMACTNTAVIEGIAFILAIGIVLSPLVFILVSYFYIVRAVLSMQSSSGRHKVFNTCGSHLTVVSLFYGNIIYMYMQPGTSSSKDQGKFLTLFYNMVTPLLNPLIYTLRNKEVKGALRRLIWGNYGQMDTVLFTVIAILFAVALIGNITLVHLIRLDRRLHTPMYFLLSQLSIINMMYISTTVPKMAANFLSDTKTISFLGCEIQTFVFVSLGGSEALLLGFMSYDRYLAICQPLHYPVLMSRKICCSMVTCAWSSSSINA